MKHRTLSWKIRPYPSFLQIPYFHLFFTKFQPCSKRIRVNDIISPQPKWLPVENCPRILFSEGAALRVEAPCVHHYLSTRMWGMAWLDFTQPRFFMVLLDIWLVGSLVGWLAGWLVGWWSSWDLFEMFLVCKHPPVEWSPLDRISTPKKRSSSVKKHACDDGSGRMVKAPRGWHATSKIVLNLSIVLVGMQLSPL